jgi:dipeptidyl aminopeptidase/acylaminoacyl peptidase
MKDGPNELKMDIYSPPNLGADERRPVFLFIHGGPIKGYVAWPTLHIRRRPIYEKVLSGSGSCRPH